MKRIEEAIKKEQEYLEYRMKGQEPYNFIDVIKDYGFGSLEEYEQEKKTLNFINSDFTFIEQEPFTGILKCIQCFKEEKSFVLFANSDKNFVFCGDGSPINTEYCLANKIPIIPIYTFGGAIVNSPGDFSFCICCKKNILDNSLILNKVCKCLQKYTDKNVTVDKNDILIDGKKVCGSAHYLGQSYFMFVGYFSFSDKTNLIQQICTTTKKGKEIGYIDFINRDTFRQEIQEWLQIK